MSGSNPSPEQIEQLQQMAWNMFEERLFAWANTLRSGVRNKRNTDWRTGQDAIEAAENIEASGSTEAALTEATKDIQKRFAGLVVEYVRHHQNPNVSADGLKDEVRKFLRELHNPETREVLLLAVHADYRDDVRQRLREFKRMFWGVIDLAQGNQTDDFWFCVDVLAATQNMAVEDIVQQLGDVSVEDVPSELRSR